MLVISKTFLLIYLLILHSVLYSLLSLIQSNLWFRFVCCWW